MKISLVSHFFLALLCLFLTSRLLLSCELCQRVITQRCSEGRCAADIYSTYSEVVTATIEELPCPTGKTLIVCVQKQNWVGVDLFVGGKW